MPGDFLLERIRRELPAFGMFDRVFCDMPKLSRQLFGQDGFAFPVADVVGKIGPRDRAVRAEPALRHVRDDLASCPLIDDVEVLCQPHQIGACAHDLVRERVKRAHPVAHFREKPFFLHERTDPAGEVVDRGVDERDDEHFLAGVKVRFSNDTCGQARQGPRLSASRHGGDAHGPAVVGEDVFLLGARL